MQQYIEVVGHNEVTHVKVKTFYQKDGNRGYGVVVMPVRIERQTCGGVDYKIETTVAYSGYRAILEAVKRASAKVQSQVDDRVLKSLETKSGDAWEMVRAVVEKSGLKIA